MEDIYWIESGDMGGMNIIVAVYGDWGIGCNGRQPVVIPEDRRYFRKMTSGGIVIAGRKTFEVFTGPLPNRKNIVLTRNREFKAEGIIAVNSVDEAISEVSGVDSDKIFIAGGGYIFRLFLPLCVYAYVTKIEATPVSDTFFPDLDACPEWSLEQRGATNESGGVRYSFNTYKNNNPIPLKPLALAHTPRRSLKCLNCL